jgi:hypothetical protein
MDNNLCLLHNQKFICLTFESFFFLPLLFNIFAFLYYLFLFFCFLLYHVSVCTARAKAKAVCDLLQDETRLREERIKAAKLRENLRGIGSDDYSSYDSRGSYETNDNSQSNNAYSTSAAAASTRRTNVTAPVSRYDEGVDDDPFANHSNDNHAAAAPTTITPANNGDQVEEEKKKKKKKKKEGEEKEKEGKSKKEEHDNDDPFAAAVVPAGVAVVTDETAEKKKKKKKDKEKEAPAPAAAPAASAAPGNSVASQYAALAAGQNNGGDFDLTHFADNGSNGTAKAAAVNRADVDIMTGVRIQTKYNTYFIILCLLLS